MLHEGATEVIHEMHEAVVVDVHRAESAPEKSIVKHIGNSHLGRRRSRGGTPGACSIETYEPDRRPELRLERRLRRRFGT